MKFKWFPFSKKQKQILTWWVPSKSPVATKDAIIADGAVRSGKTVLMSLSFILWSMQTFNGQYLGMAGKTIESFKRNVWLVLVPLLILRGYKVNKVVGMKNAYTVKRGNVANDYYVFGGKDEASQSLVQGFTAAGFFFDEVALMPESFVNQAVARCSVDGAKLWFNCNPEGPFHWFKTNWIDKLKEKNAIRIQFRLDDNPSLSEARKEFYKRMFSGVFYQRYILGLWVVAEGIIYSMFNNTTMVINKVPDGVKIIKKWIGIDYGQSNATTFILTGLGSDGMFYILDEYYHSGKNSEVQKSPRGYSKEYFKWLLKNGIVEEGIRYPVRKQYVFIDPSAKGFILQLNEDGEQDIRQADNDVKRGIEMLSSMIDNDMVRVLRQCKYTINEFNAYSWDPKAQQRGEDKPIKTHDHCMDALRYIVNGTRQIWQVKLRNIA